MKNKSERLYFNQMDEKDKQETATIVKNLLDKPLHFSDYFNDMVKRKNMFIPNQEIKRILDGGEYDIIEVSKTPINNYVDYRVAIQGKHSFNTLHHKNTKIKLILSKPRRSFLAVYFID